MNGIKKVGRDRAEQKAVLPRLSWLGRDGTSDGTLDELRIPGRARCRTIHDKIRCRRPSKEVVIQILATKLYKPGASTVHRGPFATVFKTSPSVPAFLTGTVLLAFGLRLVVVACLLIHVPSHTIDYNDFGWESWEMGWTARSLFLGQGFSSPFLPVSGPTALVPPLYPYLLSLGFHLLGLNTVKVAFAILGLNGIFSALTCLPLYFLTRRALNRRTASLVALAWALYPFAIYFSADRVWDYALTSLLFTCCLLLAQTLHERTAWAWFGFGALYGLTVLSNPSVASLLPPLLLVAIYRVWKAGDSPLRWVRGALLTALAFCMVCAPWQIRNHRVMHADFFVRDGFWLEFYAGNNGDTTESNSNFAHPASNPQEMKRYQAAGEIRYMAQKRAASLAFVQTHPGFFVVATARRVLRFWTGFWSFRRGYLKYEPFDLPNVPFCLFLLFFTVRGLGRWWHEDRAAAVPYVLALIIFPLPYYLTHSSMDYRQPLEPILVLLVVLGMFGTGRCLSNRLDRLA